MKEEAKRDVAAEAKALTDFVAANFVVVHIDAQYAPLGNKVIQTLEAERLFKNWIPFVFTVGKNGKAAASFDHATVEVRRDTTDWYRGYDRAKLLTELKRMHAAAL